MTENLTPESSTTAQPPAQAVSAVSDFLADLDAVGSELAVAAAADFSGAVVTTLSTAITSHFPPDALRTRCIKTLLSSAPQAHEPMNPAYALAALQRVARDLADLSWVSAVLIDRDARLVVRPEGLSIRIPLEHSSGTRDFREVPFADHILASLVTRCAQGLPKGTSMPIQDRHLSTQKGDVAQYVSDLLRAAAIAKARAAVSSTQPDLSAAEASAKDWLTRCLGYAPTRVQVEALCEWGHAAKRRFFAGDDEKVNHASFPIFLGRQGTGKSSSIRALTSPWGHMARDVTLSELSQIEKKDISYADFAICFVDECRLPVKTAAALDALKNTLTADTLYARTLHTNSGVTKRPLCSYIGASNATSSHEILGGHGESQRRFHFFQCKEYPDAATAELAGEKTYFAERHKDYSTFWRNLDHTAELLYVRTDEQKIERIRARNSTQHMGSLDAWLDCKDACKPQPNTTGMLLTAGVLSAALRKEEGLSASECGSRRIARELQSLGFEAWRMKEARFYIFAQNAELFLGCLEAARKDGLSVVNHLRWDESRPGSLPPHAKGELDG